MLLHNFVRRALIQQLQMISLTLLELLNVFISEAIIKQ